MEIPEIIEALKEPKLPWPLQSALIYQLYESTKHGHFTSHVRERMIGEYIGRTPFFVKRSLVLHKKTLAFPDLIKVKSRTKALSLILDFGVDNDLFKLNLHRAIEEGK